MVLGWVVLLVIVGANTFVLCVEKVCWCFVVIKNVLNTDTIA